MMIAAISHKGQKTYVELPTHGVELEQALRSISITKEPKDMLITDKEDAACRVRLFADDEIGHEVIKLVRKTDNLALLDDTLWSLAAHDWSTVRDALEDGCARTLRQLHDQFEPNSEKLILSAIIENTSLMGIPYPPAIKKAIEVLQKRASHIDGEIQEMIDDMEDDKK